MGVKNLLLFGYGMTLGFPTIVIPAIQGGDGHYDEHPHDITLNKEQISWFSMLHEDCLFKFFFGKNEIALRFDQFVMRTTWLHIFWDVNATDWQTNGNASNISEDVTR